MNARSLPRGTAAAVLFALTAAAASAQATPLFGCYLIDKTQTTDFPVGITFNNWADAKTALDANGVQGPVTFLLYDSLTGPAGSSDFNATQTWRPLVNAAGSWGGAACFVLDEWTGVSATNNVTIKTAPGQPRIVLDGTAGGTLTTPIGIGVFYQGADHVIFEDMELKNFGFDAFCLYGETQMQTAPKSAVATGNIIRRCYAHNNKGCGVMVYGNSARPSLTTIENNVFSNNMLGSVDFFNGFGRFGHITGRRNDTTTVRHNTIYQDVQMTSFTAVGTASALALCMVGNNSNTGTAFSVVSGNISMITDQLAAAGGAPAITVTGGHYNWGSPALNNNPLSSNRNLFFDNSNSGIGAGRFAVRQGVNVLSLAAYVTLTGQEANSLTGNPLFTLATAGDFSIPPSSPAVDAGLLSGVTSDHLGNARTGAAADCGAYEAPPVGLTAAFRADLGPGICGPNEVLVGPAALTVNFQSLSTNGGGGPITSYAWDFENDGITDSVLQNPTFTYLVPGTYSVKLTIGDGVNTASLTANAYVVVQPYLLKVDQPGGAFIMTGVPSIGAPGAASAITLMSVTTTLPVGQGAFAGISYDFLTLTTLQWPIGLGDPVRTVVNGTPGFFPEAPFVLPAPGLQLVGFPAGLAVDLVQIYLTATNEFVLVTNVVRVTA
jgi:hypothetical protein